VTYTYSVKLLTQLPPISPPIQYTVLDSTGDVAKTQIGTPYYLSPEICEDKPYGKKSDIWSLGCVLYEIAALTLPFQARNLPALAHRIMTKSPEPLPASHRYSLQLQRLVSSLLNKKPENRPSIVNILKVSERAAMI